MLTRTFDTALGLPLDSSVTLRITSAERMRWQHHADQFDMSTSKYIRMMMASEDSQRKLSILLSRENRRQDYAVILHALGKSRIASNLNQLAHAANVGNVVFTPDVVAQINEAYEVILYIRTLLIKGARGRPC
ncbi:MAG: plasmid mobilization relaxosome protein MobC [Pseudomonadota bacterium]